eukprot:6599817-Alexandrium_andersonii.AAC.1
MQRVEGSTRRPEAAANCRKLLQTVWPPPCPGPDGAAREATQSGKRPHHWLLAIRLCPMDLGRRCRK